MEVFSTIRSPVFSELVVVLTGNAAACLPQEAMLFETLRKMKEARPFELVFSFEGPCFVWRRGLWEPAEARCKLREALDFVVSKGFLKFLDSPPTIRLTTQPHDHEWDPPDYK